MKQPSFTLAIYVALAVSSLPLACGDDPAPPSGDDADSGGAGAGPTGGSAQGGTGGQGAGETGGRATGGSGNVIGGNGGSASGGTGGSTTGGTSAGGGGGDLGGEAGMSGAGEGGVGGASDGGAGGEGGVDEETAHCERICTKVDPLMCEAWSECVEYYCDVIAYLYYPFCRPYGAALVKCLDERATPDEFECWYGHAAPEYIPEKSSCVPEMEAAMDVGCL